MVFIYERGKGRRRVMHVQKFSPLGEPIMRAFCHSDIPFNTTCNLPLGRRICKRCLRIIKQGENPTGREGS